MLQLPVPTPGAKQEIEHKFSELVGKPVDTEVLDEEVTKIWGNGRYSAVGYRMTEVNDQPGLLIHARQKTYAPPFLNLALELNNTSTDVLDVNLRGRVTLMDILSEGSEIRLDASVGSELSLGGEYYYVVKRTHFFVAPYAFAQRTKTGVFAEEEQVAQYEVRRSAFGADLGYEFSSASEFRLGYRVGRLEASREIGDPVLPEVEGEESQASMRYAFDNTDSAVVPTRGFLIGSNLRYVLDSPILEESLDDNSFTQYSARASGFIPFGRKEHNFRAWRRRYFVRL